MMGMNISERIRLLVAELTSRRKLATSLFIVVTLAVTAAGIWWPKSFTSYATVHVAENNLMNGLVDANSDGPGADWGGVAQEILFGRSVVKNVASGAGLDVTDIEPEKVEHLLEGVRERTEITRVGESIIRIEYSDIDPKRAQTVAQGFAEAFIDQVIQANASSSEETLAFIERQADKYEQKLQRLEAAVEEFRQGNGQAGATAEERASERVATLSDEYQAIKRALNEAEVRKKSLREQLATGAGSANLMSSVEEAYQAELSELRERLAELRLRYHDNYPDVRTTKGRIAQVEERLAAVREGSAEGDVLARDAVRASPVYESLRSEAYEADTRIQTLKSQLAVTEKQLDAARQAQEEVRRSSNKLAQLTRDYEVTKELHQDLLRRRETARVSASLKEAGTASGLRIEEPAFFPHQAEGPRLLYFLMGGLGLGLLFPVGLIFSIQQIDPRIRRSDQLSEFADFPVLAAVPHYHRPAEAKAQVRGIAWSTLMVILGVSAVAFAGILRFQGEI